jgi:hypothetical protein
MGRYQRPSTITSTTGSGFIFREVAGVNNLYSAVLTPSVNYFGFSGYIGSAQDATIPVGGAAVPNGTVLNIVELSIPIQGWSEIRQQDIAVSPDQSDWRIDANIGGANVGFTPVTSYTAFENASLDLVLNTGSAAAKIACSGTNAATGLTCSTGSEQVGLVFTNALTGWHRVCIEVGGNKGNLSAGSVQLVETGAANQTIIQEGKSRVYSSDGSSGFVPVKYSQCGTFYWASVQERAVRFMYEWNNTVGVLNMDRDASFGQPDAHITIENISFGQSRPILTGDQVTSKGVSNPAIYSAKISGAGVVSNEKGDFINGSCSIANTSQFTCNFTASYFSATPNCFPVSNNSSGGTINPNIFIESVSSSQVVYKTMMNGANSPEAAQLLCHGEK